MKKALTIALSVFLLLDICYSFVQHYNSELDGDMASIIVPSEWYSQVLNDPIGIKVITSDSIYAAPNRFFLHWSLSNYFKSIPGFLQSFLSPIDSVYAASAIAKTLIQVALIYLIAMYISGTGNLFSPELILAAALITPLFQTSGYYHSMGIIDKSITYTFSYSLSIVLLLLFFAPFYKGFYSNQSLKLTLFQKTALIVLSFLLAFSGPIIPGVIIIGCPLILANILINHYTHSINHGSFVSFKSYYKKIPFSLLVIFSFVLGLCFYSLFIGFNNAENFTETIPVLQRYARIPSAIISTLTTKLGYPLLIIMILLNIYLIKRNSENEEGKRITVLIKWLSIFILIYILLLPLGGYRNYRPDILRRDTILPITIALLFMYGISSFFLLKNLKTTSKKIYCTAIIIFMLNYTIADEPKLHEDDCQRSSLQKLSESNETIVQLPADCGILSWDVIHDFHASEINSQLLQHWGITKEKKFYYQK